MNMVNAIVGRNGVYKV